MENCIFCKIIKGEVKAETLYEDDDMIIIKDITPRAKLHSLIIPKAHYKLLSQMKNDEPQQLLRAVQKFVKIAPGLGYEKGYRLIVNQDDAAHQTIDHLHIHALGGEMLEDF